jgi:Domain of unknown function (DUF4157)
MSTSHDRSVASTRRTDDTERSGPEPGKTTLIQQLQLRASGTTSDESTAEVHQAAQLGTSGPSQELPYLSTIQHLFGRHDVTGTDAYVGGPAEVATKKMGATAYASNNSVAFAGAPDLHTAAHEAAHVVQQRGGVQLKGGVGELGDRYEQHADAVADRVVRGESVEELLSEHAGDGGGSAVQRRAGNSPAPAAQRSAPELLEEAIRVVETALAMAHGGPHTAATPTASDDAAPKVSAETVAHLRTARAELSKLRGASEEEILTAVTPILSSIGAPGVESGPAQAGSGESPVQRNTLVLGAPLLGAGPPGWVVYTVLAVGSAGVVGYAVYRENASRRERERAIADTATDEQGEHRGRIQVQGGGLEKSFPWARPAPMTKAEAQAGMEALRLTLSRRELQVRSEAFASAKKFIDSTLHTCPPQISRTFQNKAIRQSGGEERVDIEIRTGIAFA